MSEHIEFVNPNKNSIIHNYELLKSFFIGEMNFKVVEAPNEHTTFLSEELDVSLYYLNGNLWGYLYNDEDLEKYIHIASLFKDGTRVRDENGFSYTNQMEAYIHKDDECQSLEKSNMNIRLKQVLFHLIFGMVMITLYVIAMR